MQEDSKAMEKEASLNVNKDKPKEKKKTTRKTQRDFALIHP